MTTTEEIVDEVEPYVSVHSWAPMRIDIRNEVIAWKCTVPNCAAVSLTIGEGAQHTPAKDGICPCVYNYAGKQELNLINV